MIQQTSAAALAMIILASSPALAGRALSETAPVTVSGGRVKGTNSSDGSLSVFRGIPYAAPPIGNLRWRPPQPVVPWQGIKDASNFSPICMQPQPLKGNSLFTKLFFTPIQPQSEDCLYLNVWAPTHTSKTKLPVIFWIPGGGFQGGSGANSFYDGSALARRGVVLVTINYRLSKLGFLAYPELTAESPDHASGNYGLMDMIAALRWVQTNISGFNGDPSKVTIFGQSAGGYAVSYLIASPLAKGLFVRAIADSGSGFTPRRPGSLVGRSLVSLSDAEKAGQRLAAVVGAKNLAELRQKSASQIMAALASERLASGIPIMDGYVLPDTVDHIFEHNRQNNVAVLTGSNANEGTLFPALHTLTDYQAFAQKNFGDKADEFLTLYPAYDDASAWRAYTTAYRDWSTAWGNWEWARRQGKPGNAPIYYYYFRRRPPAPADEQFVEALGAEVGAYHGAELAYVFGNYYPESWIWTADDRRFGYMMQSYWLNFAKTGNPNGKGLTNWPSFNAGRPKVMIFDKTSYVGETPHKHLYDFWDEYVKRWESNQSANVK